MNTYDPNSYFNEENTTENENNSEYRLNGNPGGKKPKKKNGAGKKAAAFAVLGVLLAGSFSGAFFGSRALSGKVTDAAESTQVIGSTQDSLEQFREDKQKEEEFGKTLNPGAAGEEKSAEADDTEAGAEGTEANADDSKAGAGGTEANADETAGADDAAGEGQMTQNAGAIGSTSEANRQASLTKAAAETKYDLTVADIAENTMPAMVAITNTSVEKVRNYFYGGLQDYESVSMGTGVIVGQNDTEILIATNAHVISNAETLSVTFVDETTVEGAVKGSDSKNDLAVVAVPIENISQDTLSQIKFVEIGDSDEAKVGEQVVAIGNALGYGQSVSSGYLSAKDRGVETDEENVKGLLQTDAAINPGNSGGALLNMQGELIGINSAKYAQTEVEGMGFAIPINTAAPILEKMMNRETRVKVSAENAAYLGIVCYSVSEEAAQYYHIPEGVYVQDVTPGSAAANAGVKQGDIITAIDEDEITSDEVLTQTLEYYAAGDTATITVARPGAGGQYTEENLTITFGSKPSNS